MALDGFKQAQRLLKINTPLGPDKLLLVGLVAQEAISQLFNFRFTTIAPRNDTIDFGALVGRAVSAEILSPSGKKRYFHGQVREVLENAAGNLFRQYDLEIVPEVWFLTRRAQSRIFQDKSVKEILQEVFQDLGSVKIHLKAEYEKRNFCVQYRETDWNFACRLMEEEGIFYYFTHTQNRHACVLGDSPEEHPDVPFGSQIVYSADSHGNEDEDRMTRWRKSQNLQSYNFKLWDHNFEKPGENLESVQAIAGSVRLGKEEHRLLLGDDSMFEVYDWPGGYARMFDGIDRGGGEKPDQLAKLYTENKKTARIRAEQAASAAVKTDGAGKLRQITAGHKFQLKSQSDDDKKHEGAYVVTSAQHWATLGANYMAGDDGEVAYGCLFACIPAELPFRPPALTPRPTIHGVQTATVVGPSGEEVYTDKYGRVKVHFHWDRRDKHDQDSSCWLRVAQPIAGRRWGASFWPRIGQEVVVSFLEGDPDRPIITGSVYNPDQMPPYQGDGPDPNHPDEKLVSGFKSNSSSGGDGFNEWRFYDKKDSEQFFLHAQRDMDIRVKNDLRREIERDEHNLVKGDRTDQVEGNVVRYVGGGKGPNDEEVLIDGSHLLKTGSDLHVSVGKERHEKVATNAHSEAGTEMHLKAGMTLCLEAGMTLVIKGPGGFIAIGPEGITIEGTMVKVNCGGSPPAQAKAASPKSPKKAKPAKTDDAKTGKKSK